MSSPQRKSSEKEKEKSKSHVKDKDSVGKEKSKDSKKKSAPPSSTPRVRQGEPEAPHAVVEKRTSSKSTKVGDLVTNVPVIGGRSSSSRAKSSGGTTPAVLHSPQSPPRTPGNPPVLGGYARPTGKASHKDPEQKHESRQSGSGFLDSPSHDVGNRNNERDEDLDSDGIVASSRLALARMSFENCVVAAARLQDLMMAHAAAVTSAKEAKKTEGGTGGGGAGTNAGALPPLAPRTLVNQVRLSSRPLDEIADDLANQLWQLCEAYQSSSRAERQLMGVPGGAPVPAPPPAGSAPPKLSAEQRKAMGASSQAPAIPPVISVPAAHALAAGETVSKYRGDTGLGQASLMDMAMAPGDTFGPMTSTQLVDTVHSFDFVGDAASANAPPRGPVDIAGDGACDWRIDVMQANPGPRLAAENNQFIYPDGTCVSFPISTFGELVMTELMDSRGVQNWASEVEIPATRGGQGAGGAATKEAADTAARVPNPPAAASLPHGMDIELLNSYLHALESRLTDKQQLDAMREARGSSKTKDQRSSVASLSHLAQSKSLHDGKATGTKK